MGVVIMDQTQNNMGTELLKFLNSCVNAFSLVVYQHASTLVISGRNVTAANTM